jgi:hypothetical protein
MDNQNFEVTGRVIEAKTGTGLYNLIVEAWDKDEKYDDLLGQTFTNDEGGFTISFDSTYFREYAPDPKPDLLFKVYRGKKLLKSTGDAVIYNAGLRTEVTIKIDIPEMRPAGKDRVTATQAFKAADFFQQSDFKGVYNQFKSKAGTSLGFLSDMLVNTVSKMDIKPLKVNVNKNENIIGADMETVSRNLESQDISVNEVKVYEPKVDAASLSDFAAFPLNLKAGQKVNLYEENGQVRYYSLVKETQPAAPSAETRNANVEKLTEELTITKQKVAERDAQLTQLQQEMATMRKDHEQIKTLLQSDAMVKMMKAMNAPEKPKAKK